MNPVMRLAQPDDAVILAKLGRETFEETWSFFYKPDLLMRHVNETYAVDQIRQELQDPVNTHYIAEVDGEPAGYVKLSRKQTLADWITERTLEVCRIYVYKKFYDQRIGRALMEKSIELAEKENMESIVLGVWENNHRAVSFYKKFGFEHIGSHPFYVCEQEDIDWIMRKKLL